jgi:hypothetical protein
MKNAAPSNGRAGFADLVLLKHSARRADMPIDEAGPAALIVRDTHGPCYAAFSTQLAERVILLTDRTLGKAERLELAAQGLHAGQFTNEFEAEKAMLGFDHSNVTGLSAEEIGGMARDILNEFQGEDVEVLVWPISRMFPSLSTAKTAAMLSVQAFGYETVIP